MALPIPFISLLVEVRHVLVSNFLLGAIKNLNFARVLKIRLNH